MEANSLAGSYVCALCGKSHDGLPLSFAAEYPDMYANMDRDQRDVRCVHGSDQCIIDQEWFFIRGCLEIPIIKSGDIFLWGLWVVVREEVFDEISACWELAGREKLRGPFKGRLGNSLSVYQETLNLKVQILIRPVGERPLLVIEEDDHPLAAEQRFGITRERAWELAALLLHQQRSGLPEAR
jgi:hypothetical protein